ncbi:hypothetical protein UVI_02036850 [Ustilaginoidea virens]|nr:hypothetical protein UVI_02036850 [Ustilaginoidea virens]
MSFPDTYPASPPLILFSTDMFHPLICPLTTYMYTTDVQEHGEAGAADRERLPPGGFSLRHGYPAWFGQRAGTPDASTARQGGRAAAAPGSGPRARGAQAGSSAPPDESSSDDSSSSSNTPRDWGAGKASASVAGILGYVRSAFDTAEVLDAVPLAAAGNPGAWHAWRTHRRREAARADAGHASPAADNDGGGEQAPPPPPTPPPPPGAGAREPGEWNWDGVWEARVKKGVAASLSESVLYSGSGVADDMIRFLPMAQADVDSLKETIRGMLGGAA